MQLTMEYQQKKAEEEMQKQQYEMERKQQEMQAKMAEEMAKFGGVAGNIWKLVVKTARNWTNKIKIHNMESKFVFEYGILLSGCNDPLFRL